MQVAIRMERLFTIWQPLSPSPSGSPHAINPRGFGGQRPPFKSDVFRFMPFNGYQTNQSACIDKKNGINEGGNSTLETMEIGMLFPNRFN